MADAYLLIGEAPNAGSAEQIAAQDADCPYVHFLAAFGPTVVGVWYLPETQRWWLESVAEHPQWTLGLQRAAVYRTMTPAHPKGFEPHNAATCRGTAPCGSDCRACDRRDDGCRCPGIVSDG